jgi:hypothetical protein
MIVIGGWERWARLPPDAQRSDFGSDFVGGGHSVGLDGHGVCCGPDSLLSESRVPGDDQRWNAGGSARICNEVKDLRST